MVESNIEKEGFLAQHTDFSLREQVLYPNGGKSCFYDNGIDMAIAHGQDITSIVNPL